MSCPYYTRTWFFGLIKRITFYRMVTKDASIQPHLNMRVIDCEWQKDVVKWYVFNRIVKIILHG